MFAAQARRSRTDIIIVAVLVVVCFYLVLQLSGSTLRPFVWSSPARMPSYKNYSSSYSFDLVKSLHPNWMARVPDQTSLTSLSIPGTHDTETFDLVNNTKMQCQNHDLKTQLGAGLRYFDIRGRMVIDEEAAGGEGAVPEIGIFHAQVYTGYTLEDVLLTLFEFLEQYPTEGIVMRLKEEGPPVRRKPGGTFYDEQEGQEHEADATAYKTTFEEAFNYYRLNNPSTGPGSTKHLLAPWPSPSAPAGSPLLPTMAQLRGKVIVLYEFPTAPGTAYGVPWTSPHISLEDLWIIVDLEHLEDKWEAIRTSLEAAGASPPGSDVLFLSHLSASVGVIPIEAAAGPLEAVNGSMIEGMNDRTGRLLEKGVKDGQQGKTGVIMADFPGQRLVDAILARNAWLTGRG